MAKNDSNCHAEGDGSGRLGFGDRDFNLDRTDSGDRELGVVGEWGLGDRLRYNRSGFVFTGESMITTGSSIDLQAFLQRPEIDDSPAWELLDGHPKQKPMPTAYHSILQKRLVAIVDACESPYEAFPELRCLFDSSAIVPDVAVVRRDAMPTGNLPFSGAPAWIIEILSPNQSTTRLIAKIQTCLQAGGQLGWLVDPEEEVVMVMRSGDRFGLFQGGESLPVLGGLALELTPEQMFAWLR